jgi:hypothetical protein
VAELGKKPFVTFAAGGLLRWQIFEKILLIAVVLDLALGGNGYLFKIGGFRLREILYMFCMPWVILRLTSINPIQLDKKLLWLTALFVVVTVFGSALGYFNGSQFAAIAAELKPLSYFPMLLFFLVAIRTRDDITLIAALFIVCGTLLALLYLLTLLSAKIGLVQYSNIFNFLHVSDEFIFRHTFDNQAPFVGFLYKGAFYICVAAIFLIFDPFKITKIFGALTVVAVAMTLTRSLSLALCACILASVTLNRNWLRAPMLLGQIGLLVAVMIFAAHAENFAAHAEKGLHEAPFENCTSHCNKPQSTFQAMQRPLDSDRIEDMKFIWNQLDIPMLTIGRGLGSPIRGDRQRIELTYFEVLYKQGMPGLLVWFLLFAYILQLYRAVPAETKGFAVPLFLSSLFVFIATAATTFLTGSIGMGVVFISTASLLVLAQESPVPMRQSDWYGEWLGGIFRF